MRVLPWYYGLTYSTQESVALSEALRFWEAPPREAAPQARLQRPPPAAVLIAAAAETTTMATEVGWAVVASPS